jgi:hypothetical protein
MLFHALDTGYNAPCSTDAMEMTSSQPKCFAPNNSWENLTDGLSPAMVLIFFSAYSRRFAFFVSLTSGGGFQ